MIILGGFLTLVLVKSVNFLIINLILFALLDNVKNTDHLFALKQQIFTLPKISDRLSRLHLILRTYDTRIDLFESYAALTFVDFAREFIS